MSEQAKLTDRRTRFIHFPSWSAPKTSTRWTSQIAAGFRLRHAGTMVLEHGFLQQRHHVSSTARKAVLRYRGIPSRNWRRNPRSFETAYRLSTVSCPPARNCTVSSELLTDNEMLHEDMKFHFEGFPTQRAPDGDPLLDDQRGQLFSPAPDGGVSSPNG